jgi:hypothetical protein
VSVFQILEGKISIGLRVVLTCCRLGLSDYLMEKVVERLREEEKVERKG